MEKFATGKTMSLEYTKARVNGWVKRWREQDPFAGMDIHKKNG